MTHFPVGDSQSVQHTTCSVLRASIQKRKNLRKKNSDNSDKMRGEIELRRQTDMLQMLSSQNRPTYYNSLTYNKSVDLLSAMGA